MKVRVGRGERMEGKVRRGRGNGRIEKRENEGYSALHCSCERSWSSSKITPSHQKRKDINYTTF